MFWVNGKNNFARGGGKGGNPMSVTCFAPKYIFSSAFREFHEYLKKQNSCRFLCFKDLIDGWPNFLGGHFSLTWVWPRDLRGLCIKKCITQTFSFILLFFVWINFYSQFSIMKRILSTKRKKLLFLFFSTKILITGPKLWIFFFCFSFKRDCISMKYLLKETIHC